jgi:phosphatidylserine/phosphatidylglycerophosphate/cardiolipin synthase-like enzyme
VDSVASSVDSANRARALSPYPARRMALWMNAGGALEPPKLDMPVRRGEVGVPLPADVRRDAERILGEDLSDVRIHVGPEPRRMRALAFTLGPHIYFAPGLYDPRTREGRTLLGHELTHVVQQRRGRAQNRLGYGIAVVRDPALEHEAARIGGLLGSAPASRQPSAKTIQRMENQEVEKPQRTQITLPSALSIIEYVRSLIGEQKFGEVLSRQSPKALLRIQQAGMLRWCKVLTECDVKWVLGAPYTKVALRGPAIFKLYAELIEEAQSEICLQTFVWRDDTDEDPCEPTRMILTALKKLDERLSGSDKTVNLYLLLDELYFSTGGGAAKRALNSIDALKLECVNVIALNYYHAERNALHSKSLVVDGQCALLTGANVQPFYNKDRSWYDGAYLLRGGIAMALRNEFADAWALARGELPKLFLLHGSSSGTCPCAILGRPSSGSTWWSENNLQCKGFLAVLEAAAFRIRIHTPNLNAPPVLAALVAAVKRGVKVELVLSKGFNDNTESWSGGTNDTSVKAIRAKLETSELDLFDARWYSVDGDEPIDDTLDEQRKFASHAKYLSVDSQIVIVGSSNLDNQSWYYSREVNVIVNSIVVTMAWDYAFFTPSFNRAIKIESS